MAKEARPMPKFKITIAETRKGRQMFETTKRYQVFLNGKPFRDPLYFNMHGYCGYLPTPAGGVFDPGEISIAKFRKEAAEINRDAARPRP
jgi:hypothetical protein